MLPYQAAVDAGVGSVMASFNEVDGIPATASKWLMTDVLRNPVSYTHLIPKMPKAMALKGYDGIS